MFDVIIIIIIIIKHNRIISRYLAACTGTFAGCQVERTAYWATNVKALTPGECS